MSKPKVVYYTDEVNEDFAGTSIKQVEVGKDFPFAPTNKAWRILEWMAYYLVAVPLVSIFCYLFCGFRIKNRSALKRLKKQHKGGYFIYLNHTHFTDAFVGPLVSLPYKAHIIANPDAVSIKGLRTFEQMIGCIPLLKGKRKGYIAHSLAVIFTCGGNRPRNQPFRHGPFTIHLFQGALHTGRRLTAQRLPDRLV